MRHSIFSKFFSVSLLSRMFCMSLAMAAMAPAIAEAQQPTVSESDAIYSNYQLRGGTTVQSLRLHYVTMGTPHRNTQGDIDNAVLVLHWTGNSGASLLTPEYRQSLYGPGRPLDASRYYLIIPDNFGHGKSTRPSDGLRAKFPSYGYNDLVDLQHKLVTETLGVKRLHALLGMSMGGMNAWQWAEAYPDAVGGIMPVVSLPVRVSGRNLLWRRIAIDAIRNDPDWQRGDYVKMPRAFIQSYRMLNMMIDGVPHLQAQIVDEKKAEAYLSAVDRRTEQSDPNDLLYSLESSRDYDVEAGLANIKAKVFALNFNDDEFNPDELQILQDHMHLIPDGRFVIQSGSSTSSGHLTMAHPSQWAKYVQIFMDSLKTD